MSPGIATEFEVAHVNHRLRGAASGADERFVRGLAKEIKWKCHVVACPVKPLKRGNLEETAREYRYDALTRIAIRRRCCAIFTAHTLDDQAETVIMNLLRGTGPDGLAGMAPVRLIAGTRVRLCRPLLGVSKSELMQWLRGSKSRFRIDASNQNPVFLRNWLRSRVVPAMEKRSPGFKHRLAALASLARDEKGFWQQETERVKKALLKPYKRGWLLDLGGLLSYSPAVQRRFLRRALGQNLLTFEAVERLREWMQSPPSGGRLWQLRRGWIVERLSKSKGSPSPQLFWFRQSKLIKEKNNP